MKTMLKITALAVITALIALACAPDAELTARDWSEYNSQRDAKITNSQNDGTSATPVIKSGTNGATGNALKLIPSAAGATPLSDEDKQLQIEFPADADFLKAANDKLTSELQKFLSIHTFNNPIPASTPATTEQYVFSADKAEVEYEFVRRENPATGGPGGNTNKAVITIQLTNYQTVIPSDATPGNVATPATGTATTSALGVVMKIDGAKYKVGGKSIDRDDDGKAGEAIYDDVFVPVAIDGTGVPTYVPPGGPRSVTLTIATSGFAATNGTAGFQPSVTANDATREFQIASLSGASLSSTGSADAATMPAFQRHKAILEALIPQFQIQKFDGSKWVDAGATISYQSTYPEPADSGTFGTLWAKLTVEDFVVYRLYADKLKGMKTSGQAAFYGAELKIGVSGVSGEALRTDKYISGNQGYYNQEAHHLHTFNSSDFDVGNINYNNAGKKATVELKFPQINFTPHGQTTASNFHLDKDTAVFAQNVKFAFSPKGDSLTDLTSKEIAFLKYTVVEIKDVHNTANPPVFQHTLVTLTIEDGIKASDSFPDVYLVTSPDFKYSHAQLYFGNFADIDTKIDGTKGWKLHAQIN